MFILKKIKIIFHPIFRSPRTVDAQRKIAMIAEMIHSASLIHDDVIDQSFSRRGKPSVNVLWNHKKVSTQKLLPNHYSSALELQECFEASCAIFEGYKGGLRH